MINDKNISQEGGDNCKLINADSVTINGVSAQEAMDIATNVYNANFLKLAETASEMASYRAESLARKFVEELSEKNESYLEQIATPDVQISLYDAQRQFAKSGDKNSEKILVDLLTQKVVDIHGNVDRGIRQIALDESISIVSKITPRQLDTLSIIFITAKTLNHNVNNLKSFNAYLESYYYPFAHDLLVDDLTYLHLEQIGCGSRMQAGYYYPIQQLLRDNYKAIFSKGFELSELNAILQQDEIPNGFVIPAQHAVNLFQLNAMTPTQIPSLLNRYSLDEAFEKPLSDLLESTTMSLDETKDYLLSNHPQLSNLIECWEDDEGPLNKFELTPVGIALAIANIKNKTGISMGFEIWVK
ncbi:LPO_1073/Vpar_1526 family protein [Photobacterium sp. J15]|uniref:LPO_1073/Vpar_1526 family protein n=1 Tax=Photobacterium sp. J15 TaxID=265901 RepID=UPI000A99AB56|nr:LPO_1073/Vpar_1526 family protein [Photobacterium sp. J15]